MADKRVGIKEIAALSGLSAGNVSMVLSGRGDEARISKSSQQRVLDAARQLNYRPNIYAKRLRLQNTDRPLIAVFFTPDKHATIVGRFFAGIHDIVQGDGWQGMLPEIALYPYTRDRLVDIEDTIHSSFFNSAVFMGMSQKDSKFLEKLALTVPVVLFNRRSTQYHSVCADNLSIGHIAARLFAQNGCKRACLVTGKVLSLPGKERVQGFVDECKRLGIALPQELIYHVDKVSDGGKQAGQLIPLDENAPDAVFFSESFLAVSTLPYLLRRGIQIPKQLSLICYGDESSEEFMLPSLTSIRVPIEAMSYDCVRVLMEVHQKGNIEPTCTLHQPSIIIRESFVPLHQQQ